MEGGPWAVQGPRLEQQALPRAAVSGAGFSERNENIKHRKEGGSAASYKAARQGSRSLGERRGGSRKPIREDPHSQITRVLQLPQFTLALVLESSQL